ncbi:MAG: EamA family transporter [Clostridia bacterium]|nr:EamA family transporter [Clostridia bacterium]
MKKNYGMAFVLAAGVFWGFMGVFVNILKSLGFNATQCTTLRITAAALIFLVYTLVTQPKKLKIRLKDIPLLAATGMIGVAGMSLLYISCIDKTSLSVAAVLLYLSPVWVMLMSLVFLKDKFTWIKAAASVIAFLGCYFVAGTGEMKINAGVLLGLASGVAYASYSIFGTFALKKHEPETVTTYAFLFGALLMLIIGDMQGIAVNVSQNGEALKTVLFTLLTGLVTAVLPFLLYTKGLETVSAGKAAVLACAEPLCASILGRVLYGETLNYLGIFLIVASILILQKKQRT